MTPSHTDSNSVKGRCNLFSSNLSKVISIGGLKASFGLRLQVCLLKLVNRRC